MTSYVYLNLNQTDVLSASFDISNDLTINAYLNIFKTLFVCLLLGVGAFLFTRDANYVIIGPVLVMIEKI